MRKKRNILFSISILVIACLCMSACASSDEPDVSNDKVNTEQDADDRDDVNSTPDKEDIDDSDDMWEEEEDNFSEDPAEEEITLEEDIWVDEEPEDDSE